MSPARILVLISMLLFALISLSPICSPLECLVPRPSYLVSYVKSAALPLEIAIGAGYFALCAIAARRNQKGFAVFVLIVGLVMALVTFARFIWSAASTGEI